LIESRGDLKMKDVFSKLIPEIAQALKDSFPDKDIASIYRDGCASHLKQNILPGYACYKALVNMGIPQEQAIDFVELEMCKAVERLAKLCRNLSTRTYAFSVFMKVS